MLLPDPDRPTIATFSPGEQACKNKEKKNECGGGAPLWMVKETWSSAGRALVISDSYEKQTLVNCVGAAMQKNFGQCGRSPR